jgi:large subunit ribosomal protein L25|tara:strand:- start:90 stop:731 length:642 start_codon:yes stop_codon:yes gene_type:complete
METIDIKAEARSQVGKGSARAARRAGLVPAVIYGNKETAVSVTLDANQWRQLMHKPGIFSQLININVNNETHFVLPRDIQQHPVSEEAMHVDFLRVTKNATVAVGIAVEFINEDKCTGLKLGGVLNIVRSQVELNCPAISIPEKLTVDLEGLNVGHTIHISSIELPEGCTPTITDRDFTVATIAAPRGGLDDADETEDTEEVSEETEESKSDS